MEISDKNYFQYLKNRSILGGLYRKYYLYPKIDSRLEGRVLDVGCGIGDMLQFRKNTVGIDINKNNVEYCNSIGLKAVLMEKDILPFQQNTFDSILLDNVLEHIPDPQALIKEIYRVLIPGGRFVVGVPGTKGWNSDPTHVIYYDENTMVKLFSSYGFSDINTFYSFVFKSKWLSEKIKQYCVYMLFIKTT